MLTKRSLQVVAVVSLIWAGCLTPAASLALDPLQPEDNARCAACGMLVAPYPNWLAAVAFKDGSRNFFDGPKDMFTFIFDLQKYRPGASVEDIAEVQVTDYYTAQRQDAREVFFVVGSDVLGPMGRELVPVAGLENLKTFLLDHGHEKVLRFDGLALVPADPPR